MYNIQFNAILCHSDRHCIPLLFFLRYSLKRATVLCVSHSFSWRFPRWRALCPQTASHALWSIKSRLKRHNIFSLLWNEWVSWWPAPGNTETIFYLVWQLFAVKNEIPTPSFLWRSASIAPSDGYITAVIFVEVRMLTRCPWAPLVEKPIGCIIVWNLMRQNAMPVFGAYIFGVNFYVSLICCRTVFALHIRWIKKKRAGSVKLTH